MGTKSAVSDYVERHGQSSAFTQSDNVHRDSARYIDNSDNPRQMTYLYVNEHINMLNQTMFCIFVVSLARLHKSNLNKETSS